MSRKKRKIFPKKQLIQLFESQNYQKVVSKIKQFTIEDISEDELVKMHLNSLVNLSIQHFEIGDIQRALRDIELALDIKVLPNIQLLRLKYLCYFEKFQEAYEYSKSLLDIKENKIKKDIVFYCLISNIYSTNSIDENYLKLLTKAKQNYILGLLAFFNDDIELCLKYLDDCNPRLIEEKENLKALKSIIINKDYLEYENSKPLYRFLLFGDDQNLQNTKNTRENKQIVLKQFKQQKSNNALQNLIELKHPIDSILLKQQDDIKLIYNNIVLLLEIDNNYEKALKLFLDYKDKLVNIPESIYLLLKINEQHLQLNDNQKFIQFIKKYLQLHSDKLAPFTIKYIFYSIFTYMTNIRSKTMNNQYVQLAKEYNQLPLQYMIQEISSKLEPHNQELINQFFSKFDKINEMILKDTILGLESYEEISDYLDDTDKIIVAKRVGVISQSLNEIENLDKKYKDYIFRLIDAMSLNLLHFSINYYPNEYNSLTNCISKYSEIFELEIDTLPQSMKNIFIKVKTQTDYIEAEPKKETMLDTLKRLTSGVNFGDGLDDFFDEDNLECEFEEIFGEFKMALKSGDNPYDTLQDFPYFYHWFFEREFENIVFDLIGEYARFKTVTSKVIEKIFKLTGFELNAEIVRKRLPAILNEYAKHNPDISLQVLEYLIDSQKNYETAWYMQWLYIYLDIAFKNNKKQNKIYKTIIARFVEIQKKKKFTTFNKKYEKIVKMFKLEDVEYDGSYEQKSFEF
ncbi:MAG: hypothetical protein U9Q20_08875 [Campylobacterota bacterium]|nr:hypothetical protein [Campylobacterota bacterium]